MICKPHVSDPVLREFYLLHAPPSEVHQWIQQEAQKTSLYDVLSQATIEALVERAEPLIDLALALHSREPKVLRKYFLSGAPAYRRAVLRNRFRESYGNVFWKLNPWIDTEEFLHLCEGEDWQDISVYFTNPRLKADELSDVFRRREPYDKLEDGRWWGICCIAVGNPNANGPEPEMSEFGDDGWGWAAARRPHGLMWEVFAEIPVTRMHGEALCHYLQQGDGQFVGDTDLLGAILERWDIRGDASIAYTEDEKATVGPTYSDLREEVASRAAANSTTPEAALVRDHADVAVRRGYYRGAWFYSAAQIESCCERDGDGFLEAVYWNNLLYAGRSREAFAKVLSIVERSTKDSVRELWANWKRRACNLAKENPVRYADCLTAASSSQDVVAALLDVIPEAEPRDAIWSAVVQQLARELRECREAGIRIERQLDGIRAEPTQDASVRRRWF